MDTRSDKKLVIMFFRSVTTQTAVLLLATVPFSLAADCGGSLTKTGVQINGVSHFGWSPQNSCNVAVSLDAACTIITQQVGEFYWSLKAQNTAGQAADLPDCVSAINNIADDCGEYSTGWWVANNQFYQIYAYGSGDPGLSC